MLHPRQRIKADRPLDVGGVDVDEIVGTGAGDVIERGFGEVAVRIEQRNTFAGREVLGDEVKEQRALAGAGLADDVEVPAAIVGTEHDWIAQEVQAPIQNS